MVVGYFTVSVVYRPYKLIRKYNLYKTMPISIEYV